MTSCKAVRVKIGYLAGLNNDVLIGGLDGQASDLMFGGPGDDAFQPWTDYLPNNPLTGAAFDPNNADVFFGGEGNDQVLVLGGDFANPNAADPNQRGPIRDFVMLGYDRFLGRHSVSALDWDQANNRFVTNSGQYTQKFAYFEAIGIEQTSVNLQAGDDILHADPEYKLGIQSWGVTAGDVAAGASAFARIQVSGGDGSDILYGSGIADVIDAGAGNDFVFGGEGDDRLLGNFGDDVLHGKQLGTLSSPTLANLRIGTPDGSPLTTLPTATTVLAVTPAASPLQTSESLPGV